MNEENNSIHNFDFNLICDYFSLLKRQGPGSSETTIKALSFIDNLTTESKIADIGCGTGSQTMILAQHTRANIVGVDLFPGFINQLIQNAEKLGLQHRIKGVVESMDNLSFKNESLDLIWSEGAIYNIGFSSGLKLWHHLLKKGGYIAITDACWFSDKRPIEIENYWLDDYPGIDTVGNKVKQMESAGYSMVAVFDLPESCWTENYYHPQKEAQKVFLQRNKRNKFVQSFVVNQQQEAEMYEKYKSYYGYTFFIGKKS